MIYFQFDDLPLPPTNLHAVSSFCQSTSNIYRCNHYLLRYLLTAVQSGSLECVQCLLDHGADVNVQCFDNSTVLHRAVQRNQLSTLRALLASGGRVDIAQESNITPIFVAAQFGFLECLQCLIEHIKTTGRLSISIHILIS